MKNKSSNQLIFFSFFFADMNLFILHGLILLGFSIMIIPEAFAYEQTWSQSMLLPEAEIPLKKCRYFREKTMLTCSCQSLSLEEIPPNLDSNIEVNLSVYLSLIFFPY